MAITDIVDKYAGISAAHHVASNLEPKWQPSAVEEFANNFGQQFDINRRHKSTGESLEVFARKYADARPHVHIPSAHSVADLGLQVAAYFGIDGNLPTYTARGQLLKSLPGTDEEKAAALAYLDQAYQWDPKTRKAGIPPDDFHKALESAAAIAEADAAEKRAKALRLTANSTKPTPKADHRTNPWSKENWNVTAQGNCVRALGAEKASRIAAAVGCVLGSTKPSPHY